MLKYNHLLGKQFDLGVQDCFQMCRDFFKDNFDIDIPDISRPHDWKADDLDLIGDFYHLTGFEKIDSEEEWPPHPADVLVVTLGGSTPNHLAIYVDNNEIIDHRTNRLSTKETLRPVWRRYTSYILRHPNVPDMRVEKPLVNLEDILRDRFI